MTRPPAIRTIPPSFHAKKSQVLRSLNQPTESYTDNSPKGTVDAQIRDLIDEINAYEGFVTTSSCAGRVAVFVEGPRRESTGAGKAKGIISTSTSTSTGGGDSLVGKGGAQTGHSQGDGGDLVNDDDDDRDDGRHGPVIVGGGGGGGGDSWVGVNGASTRATTTAPTTTTTTTSPGGKGGGRWLFVSHDRITVPRSRCGTITTTTTTMMTDTSTGTGTKIDKDYNTIHGEYFSRLFNLDGKGEAAPIPALSSPSSSSPPRLVHLTFSPLILHIHCASLLHARPLLAAAINAGFRESGVQSLRVLDPQEADKGVMVAVRTAGLSFDTVVGYVDESKVEVDEGEGDTAAPQHNETVHRIVGEEYLRMCVAVVNQRFGWNEERRERFREELKRAMEREGLASGVATGWEDKEARRKRKREEGLARQMRTRREGEEENTIKDDVSTWRHEVDTVNTIDNVLDVLDIG
ncbi:hypothetical protein G647_04995 [Cladophialophora carrionii CBS 160.54]|uniref:tRNA(Phe) 7-[(3-amino-3-carboxypropyl)-4-demethylwyosine(37)-N(4)]-methyltransferase n=1 Tax=Cladophialophora carrionii CBS 160.54 TaxID=1279043 RepID=V9DA70_9EURO|nr:uncharacterized protein G647_04995 [Cladophialophora carrionii CBS 160.54]ETI23198.1 hypothetical protein G647_04995 [Cladophialophora carrionii CBS 160.54]